MKQNSAYKVGEALRSLCSEAPSPGEILFRCHFSAERVAERAGVSTTTARKHLDRLCGRGFVFSTLGYSWCPINGAIGYRYSTF